MSDLATAYVQIIPTTKGIGSALTKELDGEAEVAGKSAGSKLASGLKTAGKVAGGMMIAGSAAVLKFGKSAVSAGMDFDASMSQVAATMGKSVDEIDELRNFAQEMGASTSFSATQAADALNYMALAGYDADTSMQMLPTVLDLAAAGSIDLASASDMVTDAQSALGLSLDETSAMVDQMAAASSKSNTSVEQLGDAFLTIGATARNVKGGTQELATVLGVLADNGIKGSEGGTHLRNILLSLQDAAKDGTVDFGDFAIQLYDSEGNMRSMIDIVADMQTGMEGMDQASKDAAISGVFNKTDLASVNALLGTSTERFDELSGAIGDSAGAAKQMADTQLDNLQGDVTLFKSALEGAQIAVSDKLTPTLREFVQAGSEGMSQLAESIRSGDMEGAMDALSGFVENIAGKILEKLPLLGQVGIKLIEGLLNAIVASLPTLISAIPQMFQTIVSTIISVIGTLADHADELIPAVVEMILGLVDVLIDNIDLLVDAALQLALGLADGLVKAIPKLVEKIPTIISKLVSALLKCIPKIIKAGIQLFVALVENVPAIIAGIVKAIPEIIHGILDALAEFCPALADFFEGAWEVVSRVWDVAVGFFEEIWEGIAAAFSGVIEFFGALFEGAWTVITTVWNVVVGFFQAVWNGIAAVFSPIVEFFRVIFEAAWNGIKAVWDFVVGFFENVWNGIKAIFTFVADVLGGFFSAAWDAITLVWDTVTGWFGDIWKGIQDVFSPVAEVLGGFFDDAAKAIKEAFDAIIGWALDAVEAIQKAFDSLKVTGALEGKINAMRGSAAGGSANKSGSGMRHYATGGILEKGEIGLLEGTGAEAVVPLDQNEKWIHAVAEDFLAETGSLSRAVMSSPSVSSAPAYQGIGVGDSVLAAAGFGGDIIIPVSIGGRQIERIVIDAEKLHDLRTGGR